MLQKSSPLTPKEKEKELQALLGLLKLKNDDKYEDSNSKFKKNQLQTEVLKRIYDIINFPSTNTKKDLSILLAMPEKSIKVWFQNVRQACKRSNYPINPTSSDIYDLPVTQILEIIKEVQEVLAKKE